MRQTDNTLLTFGDFVDGATSRVQRVTVTIHPDRVTFETPEGRRHTWPEDELREMPDQADQSGIVLTRAGGGLERLSIADEKIARALRANAPKLHKRPPAKNPRKTITWAVGALASVALIIFVLVPMMANQLATLLPPSGEQALGDATYEQIRVALSENPVEPVETCEDERGLAALDAMITRLDAEVDLPYPLHVAVLDNELINAFALPGGRVILFRGLIEAAENPDEVAAVLAHEIGHVVNRDPTRDALRVAGSVGVLGLLFGDFAGGTVVLVLANQLINAQYSQTAEEGADRYAHELMTEADISPAALGTFFGRLADEFGDVEGVSAFFSSHPQLRARVAAAEAAAGTDGTWRPALGARDWDALRHVCDGGSDWKPGANAGTAGNTGLSRK